MHPATTYSPTTRQGLLRRFYRNRQGTTALEVALVSIPFFFLLFALLESALVYFGATTLEGVVSQSSRLIRTGQLQAGSGGSAEVMREQFQQNLCDQISGLFNCDERLTIDVRTYEQFTSMDMDDLDPDDPSFDPGGAGDIVLVRVLYDWPLLTPVATYFSNTAGDARRLMASAVFRNEPFDYLAGE